MKRLTQIGIETGTDKAAHHQFTEIYDDIFQQYESPRILEIGVYNFSSILMYKKYFKNPYVVAMDIDDKSRFEDGSWKFIRGNQSSITDLEKCVEDEPPFDIIIDDGGHSMKQQQISFGYLIDYVAPNGYYIIEDLHTSFSKSYIEDDCKVTSYEMLKLIKYGKSDFSNYISSEQQKNILGKIDNIEIWARTPSNLSDSVTGIIKLKR